MKKKILSILLLSTILAFASCKRKATVEVGNEGNINIEVTVAGYSDTIPPNTSSLFEITWNSLSPGSWRTIELYAQPVGFDNYYDSKTITLYDGDYYYWATGWIAEEENKLTRIQINSKGR